MFSNRRQGKNATTRRIRHCPWNRKQDSNVGGSRPIAPGGRKKERESDRGPSFSSRFCLSSHRYCASQTIEFLVIPCWNTKDSKRTPLKPIKGRAKRSKHKRHDCCPSQGKTFRLEDAMTSDNQRSDNHNRARFPCRSGSGVALCIAREGKSHEHRKPQIVQVNKPGAIH